MIASRMSCWSRSTRRAAQLIDDAGRVGRYSFSHALIHETLYDDHSAARRCGCTGRSARRWRGFTAIPPSHRFPSWRTTS